MGTHDWHEPHDWRAAHEELTRLAKLRAGLDREEGRALLRARRADAHHQLGYGSFAEYIARLFGYEPRWTVERLRVAEALERLPRVDQALRDAAVNWSTARELTRVATPVTESAWLERARGKTVREVERAVAGRKLGDTPDAPADPALIRHVLRFEVSAETLATFREAQSALRRDAGERLDDDALLLELARRALGGPGDAGRASYQISLSLCEACGVGRQSGAGEPTALGTEVVEMACCDGQHVGPTHVGIGARATQSVPPATRRKVMLRHGGRCAVPGCCNATFVDLHHIALRSEGGQHDEDNLTVMCGTHHRAAHCGQLLVAGRASTGITFLHADGTPYGAPASVAEVDAHARAYRALRSLGFREGETKRALERVRGSGSATSVEHVLREALQVLGDRIAAPKAHGITPVRP